MNMVRGVGTLAKQYHSKQQASALIIVFTD